MEENEIERGGIGRIHVVLSPLGSREVEKIVEVPISEDYEPGTKVMIGAAGGNVVVPPVAPPVDFKGVIRVFEAFYKSTDLVVVQQMATTGARVEGAFMPDLPPSAVRMLGALNTMGPMIQSDFNMRVIPTEWVILGRASLQVQVAQK
jgi:hypothetical protein